jgi:hypothetical protein
MLAPGMSSDIFKSALISAKGSILFESIEEVREKLAGQEYVCDRRLATVV